MKRWLQRVRGAIGMGLTWAAGWAPLGAVVGVVLHAFFPGSPTGLGGFMALNATAFAILGAVGGTIFATVLRLAEGRRRFDELSLARTALWGAVGGWALGGAAVATGFWGGGVGLVAAGMVGAATVLGAASAAGSLALARKAEDGELLHAGADVAEVGLTEKERRQLLGKRS